MEWQPDTLKPSQPFFVLDSHNFQQKVLVDKGISHFYSFELDAPTDLYCVPDGCIDLLFVYSKHEMHAYACGTVLKGTSQHWDGPVDIFGVRFMPGFFPAGVKTVLKDLIEKRVLLVDLLGDSTLVDDMAKAKTFDSRIDCFMKEYEFLEKRSEKPDGKMELCMAVKELIYKSGGLIKVSELAEQTGYSERYINKIFIELMGFPPKTFCKIIQFQNAIYMLNYGSDESSFTDKVMEWGYYDQPKFIRDFKAYAGITPSKYLKIIRSGGYKNKIAIR